MRLSDIAFEEQVSHDSFFFIATSLGGLETFVIGTELGVLALGALCMLAVPKADKSSYSLGEQETVTINGDDDTIPSRDGTRVIETEGR